MINNSFNSLFLLLITACLYLPAEAKNKKKLLIIATGETHAMLHACDCPDESAGGLPKRAYIINNLRKNSELLLVDAGGYSGGGIYDFYTEGRSRDSVRTLAAINAMARMGYDAAAIGDEELQYGARWLTGHAEKAGLPLVSANCRYISGKYVTEPYRIIKKGGVTFGITSVTTTEKLFPIDTSIAIHDPVESIRKIWKKLKRKSDYQVILSHLGEEQTQILGENFPKCDILVNGHRKMSIQPVISLDNRIIMQFGFQGKYLSSVKFDPQKKVFLPAKENWIAVADSISDDPDIVKLISLIDRDTAIVKFTVIDLYIMSQCPYGIPALREMHYFYENFPFIELYVWFIGDVNPDGSLHSLHGKQEMEEEKMWLAVKNLYPEMWYSFLYLRADMAVTTEQAVADLELDTAAINTRVREIGESELTYHYQRSQRLNIDASPTMLINNQMFDSKISYLRVANEFCEDMVTSDKPPVCDSIPECFEDSDCIMKGKIGVCISPSDEEKDGKCSYKDAVSFDFTIVIPDSPIVHTEHEVIATTEELFPGVKIRVISMSSSEGKILIKEIDPPCLPIYLFDKEVKKAVNFLKIESGLEDAGNWLTFTNDIMEKHYFLKRKKSHGSVFLYIDPLFPDIYGVIKNVLEMFPHLDGITIRPVIYESNISDQSSPEEKMRQEEALRWIVLERYYANGTFADYLNSYRTQPGSSYWFSILKEMKINVDDFVEKVNKSSVLIQELRADITKLEISEPVELLIENREKIILQNKSHLKAILEQVKHRIR